MLSTALPTGALKANGLSLFPTLLKLPLLTISFLPTSTFILAGLTSTEPHYVQSYPQTASQGQPPCAFLASFLLRNSTQLAPFIYLVVQILLLQQASLESQEPAPPSNSFLNPIIPQCSHLHNLPSGQRKSCIREQHHGIDITHQHIPSR